MLSTSEDSTQNTSPLNGNSLLQNAFGNLNVGGSNNNNNGASGGAAQNQNYNWLGVLKFLQDQYKELRFRENESMLEKQSRDEKIAQLESDLKTQEQINLDLIKRIKMLEFSLRQERIRYSKLLAGANIAPNLVEQAMKDDGNAIILQPQILPPGPKKAPEHRPLLLKILEEIGIGDIFNPNSHQTAQPISLSTPATTAPLNYQGSQNNAPDSHQLDSSFIELNRSYVLPSQQNATQSLHQSRNSNLEDVQIKQALDCLSRVVSYLIEMVQQIESSLPLCIQLLKPYSYLRGHLDGVREAFFVSDQNTLATVSEDCVVKLWDTNSFVNASEETFIEPYLTLREHTGCLLTVAGFSQQDSTFGSSSSLNRYLFTSGSEGIVKVWNIPSRDQVDTFGPTENKNASKTEWQISEEPVWQIVAHPFERQILAASADGFVTNWKLLEDAQPIQGKLLQKYSCYSSAIVGGDRSRGNMKGDDNLLIPTSCTWINTNLNLIAVSYSPSSTLVLFDKESKQIVNIINTNNPTDQSQNHQGDNNHIYRIVSHPQQRILVSAHQDGQIQFSDISQNAPFHKLKAHQDSVTSFCFHKDPNYFTSSGHDGFLRVWDLRNHKCLTKINAHASKYDESIHSVTCSPSQGYIASTGADGIVNIYQSFV